jgi:alpha-ribazole phosphatase
MEIYLVRHTITIADKTVCYGQADIPADINQFNLSLSGILLKLPESIETIFSSPLIRCSFLTKELVKQKYPAAAVKYDNRIKELNFGDWEMKKWDEINQTDLQKWMNNFTVEKVPGGESNTDLHERVVSFWNEIIKRNKNCCIVTHAGVIRSILSIINKSELQNAFTLYPVKYGAVIKILRLDDCSFKYTLLETT